MLYLSFPVAPSHSCTNNDDVDDDHDDDVHDEHDDDVHDEHDDHDDNIDIL